MSVYVSVQILSAVVLDLIGAVGYVRREFAWQRALGVAFMVAGVLLVTLYPGKPAAVAGVRPPVGRSLTHLFVRRPAAAAAAGRLGLGGGGGVGRGRVVPLAGGVAVAIDGLDSAALR